MNHQIEMALLGAAHIVVLLAGAPLLQGLIRKLKARLQSRHGPPLLQSYHDLAKLFARSEMVAGSASAVQVAAPWIILGATLAPGLFVPLFAAESPMSRDGDLLVVIGLFALARAALTLGSLDSGATFGQMGTSRELAVGALVEPALMLALASLAVGAGTTRLDEIVAVNSHRGTEFVDLPWALALAAMGIVLVAETGRIPVDNPDTHLELTMTHEAMLLEYSGRSLGILHLAAMVKQLLLACLIVNLFFPFALATDPGALSYLTGAAVVAASVALLGAALGLLESVVAKMRLYELPDLVGSASFAGLLAMAITAWQL